jgi:signal transduction histidine kinase/DNA-binding response OmpR family regulator
MTSRLISVAIDFEQDIVAIRQRARQIAAMLGFDAQDQVRIATAVSEIARNAFRYGGGGGVEFSLEGASAPQLLIVRVSDRGPGIPHLQAVLDGRYRSSTGMGLGIVGARRLMDQFEIRSTPTAGTEVVLKKMLPVGAPYRNARDLASMSRTLAVEAPAAPLQEIQQQNRELLRTLEELRERQEDLERLNRELEDTNRGVVALYAELDGDRRPSAPGGRNEIALPLEHEPRVPHAAQFDTGADAAAARSQRRPAPTEQEKQVTFIRKSAEDLTELVDDLLDIAKIEAGKIEVQPVHYTVTDLFSALRGMLRPLLVTESVQLRFEEPEDVPPLYGDEGKLSQILRNFISNALKFTERGEVRVSAAFNADRGTVTFAVADTGIGISPEDQQMIFEEFAQVKGPHQRRVKGTGLGLPLCRRLATLLGGRIELVSAPGVGSTFSATIPLHYAEPPEAMEAGVTVQADPARLSVLVVEDDEQALLICEKALRGTLYQCVPARNLRQAAEAIAQARPAAIILDLVLRGEQGWPWLGKLKADPATREIPIIIVSAVEDQRKAFALGADAYLVKPFEPQALLEALDAYTSRRILVIDDDPSARYMMRRMLDPIRYQVLEAGDGASGLTAAHAVKPDLIVLDLGLPDIQGEEVLERLREDPATREIPVCIATARDLSNAERANLAARARAVLDKRQVETEMLPRVSAILGIGAHT